VTEALRKEVAKGMKARRAYEDYIQEYIDKNREKLYKQFIMSSIINSQDIIDIKHKVDALTALETWIKSDIQTGILAETQLKKDEKLT
jgi:hypothetical protein